MGWKRERREVGLEKREGGSELILLSNKSQTNQMDENENEVHEMREIRNESVSRFVRSSKSPGGRSERELE